MRKIKYIFLFTGLCLIFLISCKDDDVAVFTTEIEETEDPEVEEDPMEEVNSLPSEFVVGVEVHNFYSATITWEEATSTLPNPIVYDLYLNETLMAETLTDTVFEFEELQELTTYTLKVIAKNEIGETPIITEFSTPEKREIRLVKMAVEVSNGDAFLTRNFEYNDGGKILSRNYIRDYIDPNSSDYLVENYVYTYGQGRLNYMYSGFGWSSGITVAARANYTYDNDQLVELTLSDRNDEEITERIHTFTSPTSYSFIKEKSGSVGVYSTTHHNVEIVLGANNELLNYSQYNIADGTTDSLLFQYENGNLTKVANDANVFEISYDDAPNFLTYSNNGPSTPGGADFIQSCGFYDVYNGSFPFKTLYRIPHFLTYKNNNNPIEYKLNGNVIHSFQYEYNPYGYPSKISSPNFSGTITDKIITYEEID